MKRCILDIYDVHIQKEHMPLYLFLVNENTGCGQIYNEKINQILLYEFLHVQNKTCEMVYLETHNYTLQS